MDQHHFAPTKRFSSHIPSRRGVLRCLASVGLRLTTPPVSNTAEAKNKHHTKRKKHKHQHEQHDPAITPSPPLPSDPVTTADAACALPWWGALAYQLRYAQTFRALRSGQLTSASFGLTYNEEGTSFELAVREIDPEGKPGYVLARTTITNVPATNVGVPPLESIPARTVTGVFATPATVVGGQFYALTVTGTAPYSFYIQAAPDNPCLDGMVFLDRDANGAFYAQESWDMAYSTFVTA